MGIFPPQNREQGMVSNRDNGGLCITTASALLVFVAAGCSNPTTSNRLPEVQDLAAQLSSSDQTITFDEGTNMALARNPINGQLIVSIQGTLFSVPESGGPAQAITDYYQDAREPQVATDGTQVVYQGYAGGTWDIYSLQLQDCLLYTSPSPRDRQKSRMPSSA